ncbi:MAG: hypothetical protein IJ546_08085 [Prevotella sp.]|nr:hypothetical protein [Prevotella sp.]
MATNKIPMRYELYQNENKKSGGYGKWYAQPVVKTTLSLKGFAKHLHDHNGTYRTSTIKGVIEEMVECLVEMVSQGVGVKLDGLGTFYPTFECDGAESKEKFDILKQLKGIHLRFLPEGTKDEELTSRKLKEKVVLVRDGKDDTDGQGGSQEGDNTTIENP